MVKVVVVDPYYAVFDIRQKDIEQHLKTEKEELEQFQLYEKISKKANIEIETLSPIAFDENAVQQFNDFSLLNEWVKERFIMGDKSNVASQVEEVQKMIDRYGTRYFAWTGVLKVKQERKGKAGMMTLSILTGVLIPNGIYYVATPKQTTSLFMMVFDIKTGNAVMIETMKYSLDDSNDILKSVYFDLFNQMGRN